MDSVLIYCGMYLPGIPQFFYERMFSVLPAGTLCGKSEKQFHTPAAGCKCRVLPQRLLRSRIFCPLHSQTRTAALRNFAADAILTANFICREHNSLPNFRIASCHIWRSESLGAPNNIEEEKLCLITQLRWMLPERAS